MTYESPHFRHHPSPHRVSTRVTSCSLLLVLFWLCVSAANAFADAEEGRKIFLEKCSACHTIGDGNLIGPDLFGVADRRDPAWLSRWIQQPEQVLAERDPLAIQLLHEFNGLPMKNQNIDQAAAESLIAHIKHQSMQDRSAKAVPASPRPVAPVNPELGWVQSVALAVFALISIIIIAVFAFVAKSTATPQAVDLKAAYKLRKVLFLSASAALISLLAITLPNNPYDVSAGSADEIVYTTARQFSFTYSREPITSVEDLQRVATVGVLEIPADTLVEFRVTSLDATHGFAVYSPKGAVVAQTQAMPGYINRLRIRFPEPGYYPVLCLEYCGTAHHIMRSGIVVMQHADE